MLRRQQNEQQAEQRHITEWLQLARTENVGPITFRQLLKKYGSADSALKAIPELAQKGGKRQLNIPSLDKIEDEIAAHEKLGAHIVTLADASYPPLLATIEDAPPIISVLGNPLHLQREAIAMVGARNASLNSRKIAHEMAKELGSHGFMVISGLARGIDTAAHQGALQAGTVAVVAGGIDNIYPPENKELWQKIQETGCVIAEMPFGSEPKAQHFPRRNRIISGLSRCLVVVEAALNSGSLITARMAAEQGREVCAIPGSPLDPRARGTNKLLKDGAILVENAEDVIHAFPHTNAFREPNIYPFPVAETQGECDDRELTENQLLDFIGFSPTSLDELARECHVSASGLLSLLLELELAGKVRRCIGNKVVRVQE